LEKTDVLVIGGGIIGTSAAYFLSKQGIDVLLIERAEIGRGASGATAGTMVLQSKELEAIPLRQESVRIWGELQEEIEEDLGFRQHGGLRVAENSQQFEILSRDVSEQRKLGLSVEILSSQELHSFAPFLGPSVVAASFCDKEARGDPLIASVALAQAAQTQGARIQTHESAEQIEINGGECFLVQTSKGLYRTSCILNCAGVWSKDIFSMVGLDFPITLSTQQAMITEQVPTLLPYIITHVEGNLSLKQLDTGNVLIGGGWEAIGDVKSNTKKVRFDSILGNVRCACRVVPALKDLNLLRCWAGLEGRSPDLLPILGKLNHLPGFYCACCAKGGFTLGPAMSKLVSELIVNGKTSFPIEAFDVNRFTDHF